jgi:hypothetical protein
MPNTEYISWHCMKAIVPPFLRIRFLKTSPPFLSSPHPTADVSRCREFGYFAKKPSKFLEITNLYITSKPYINRVHIFLQTCPLTKLYFYMKKKKFDSDCFYENPREAFCGNPLPPPQPRPTPPPKSPTRPPHAHPNPKPSLASPAAALSFLSRALRCRPISHSPRRRCTPPPQGSTPLPLVLRDAASLGMVDALGRRSGAALLSRSGAGATSSSNRTAPGA